MRFFLLSLCLTFYSTPSLAIPEHNPVPGGLVLIPIDNQNKTPKVFYKKKRVAIISDNEKSYALVGVPLNSKPGKHEVSLHWPDGTRQTEKFLVNAKSYKEQHLTIKNKRKVNPYKKDMDRILKEKKRKTPGTKTLVR